MKFEVDSAAESDQPLLDRMMQLYLYDFSETTGYDLGADGRYEYAWLPSYATDVDRHAFLARADGHLAGFALVREGEETEMAEFFVARKYRRSGLGTTLARDVFARFPGPWRVKQLKTNLTAICFWQSAIPVAWEQRTLPGGVIQQHFIIPS